MSMSIPIRSQSRDAQDLRMTKQFLTQCEVRRNAHPYYGSSPTNNQSAALPAGYYNRGAPGYSTMMPGMQDPAIQMSTSPRSTLSSSPMSMSSRLSTSPALSYSTSPPAMQSRLGTSPPAVGSRLSTSPAVPSRLSTSPNSRPMSAMAYRQTTYPPISAASQQAWTLERFEMGLAAPIVNANYNADAYRANTIPIQKPMYKK